MRNILCSLAREVEGKDRMEMWGLKGTVVGLDSDLAGRILTCILVSAYLKQSLVGGLLLPLLCAWGTVTCEQRSILSWWLPV